MCNCLRHGHIPARSRHCVSWSVTVIGPYSSRKTARPGPRVTTCCNAPAQLVLRACARICNFACRYAYRIMLEGMAERVSVPQLHALITRMKVGAKAITKPHSCPPQGSSCPSLLCLLAHPTPLLAITRAVTDEQAQLAWLPARGLAPTSPGLLRILRLRAGLSEPQAALASSSAWRCE